MTTSQEAKATVLGFTYIRLTYRELALLPLAWAFYLLGEVGGLGFTVAKRLMGHTGRVRLRWEP